VGARKEVAQRAAAPGVGAGADLRQPLGVAVVGCMIVSQALTLFTTPVTYLYMDGLNRFAERYLRRQRKTNAPTSTDA
jgi:hypothetical protein